LYELLQERDRENEVEIIVDRHAGFCTGVRRAIALAEDAAHKYGSCCTWGQLIHNPQEIARLKKKRASG